MKLFFVILTAIFCSNAMAVGVVDQSKYSCQQLNKYMDKTGGFYVKSWFGPLFIDNKGCSVSQKIQDECTEGSDYITAKDGSCEIGAVCRCPSKGPHKHKKHPGKDKSKKKN